MSACTELAAGASTGVAPALRAVDCLANETAAAAFGRLFGAGNDGGGALLPALTILLTLYVAFFAISLLAGRSRVSISMLTPRMMTLGLVLTFATSWVAYQGVVWNLAVGAPDQLASILLGARGSATRLFADRLDLVFAAVAQAADTAGGASGQAAAAQVAGSANGGSFTPANLMWLAALLLLLGTVGVLVTARIALAVLLAIGPVFVVLALFSGTRGLFAGWLRGMVLTAVTPLFIVVGGSMMLELVAPVLSGLVTEGGINGYAAMALFLIAAVNAALMTMVLKVTGAVVSGWQVFAPGRAEGGNSRAASAPSAATGVAAGPMAIRQTAFTAPQRASAMASASGVSSTIGEASSSSPVQIRHSRTVIAATPSGSAVPSLPARRARGIGSRFASRPSHSREMIR